MPSNEADNLQPVGFKKRRLGGACDICKKKKIRCDSAQMPGKRCSNCAAFDSECTHSTTRAKGREREKSNQDGYVQELEQRLSKMEKLLGTFCPDFPELLKATDQLDASFDSHLVTSSDASLSTYDLTPTRNFHAFDTIPSRSQDNDGASEPYGDLAHIEIADHFRRLSIDDVEGRFFGHSSGLMFIKEAAEMKQEYMGHSNISLGKELRRPIYWTARPWERAHVEEVNLPLFYPDGDLLLTLVDIYFRRVNIFLPLLHRPTFQRAIVENLHHRDHHFGATVLMVCALASRFCNDPRVFLEGESELSCGWKYFCQVLTLRQFLFYKATLYDVQYHCLAVLYILGTGVPYSSWNLLGVAMRFIQERGIHRRHPEGYKPTKTDEQWKRAFWCLVSLDRLLSATLGRPSSIQEEEFDVDFPLECDDEYWECADPSKNFQQPPGKPSIVAYFNSHLKLCEILSCALRTLYSTKKSQILAGLVGDQWEQRIVSELDSALNKWMDSVPVHLRWDPGREDAAFFDQSAALHAVFYHLQIQVHRPFLRKQSSLSLSSLAICTNAARSCSNLVDLQARRSIISMPHIIIAEFTAGVVLLVNFWSGKRSEISAEANKGLADLEKCMRVLQFCEKRWHMAGRFWDLLHELATFNGTSWRPPNIREQDTQTYYQPITLPSPNFEGARVASRGQRKSTTPQTNIEFEKLPLPPFNGRGMVYSGIPASNHSLFLPAAASQPTPTGFNAALDNIFPSNVAYDDREIQLNTTSSLTNSQNIMNSTAANQHQPSPLRLESQQMQELDDNALLMWYNIPSGFNMEEWDAYLENLGGP